MCINVLATPIPLNPISIAFFTIKYLSIPLFTFISDAMPCA